MAMTHLDLLHGVNVFCYCCFQISNFGCVQNCNICKQANRKRRIRCWTSSSKKNGDGWLMMVMRRECVCVCVFSFFCGWGFGWVTTYQRKCHQAWGWKVSWHCRAPLQSECRFLWALRFWAHQTTLDPPSVWTPVARTDSFWSTSPYHLSSSPSSRSSLSLNLSSSVTHNSATLLKDSHLLSLTMCRTRREAPEKLRFHELLLDEGNPNWDKQANLLSHTASCCSRWCCSLKEENRNFSQFFREREKERVVVQKSRKTAANVMPMHASIILTKKACMEPSDCREDTQQLWDPDKGFPGIWKREGRAKDITTTRICKHFSWGKKSQSPFCNF